VQHSNYYILDGTEPVACGFEEWGKFFETSDRRVAYEDRGEIRVSTVFLGINHQYGDGPPLLFETMIFGGEHDGWQERCSTWIEAEAMHKKACAIAWPETGRRDD
jgi:hypothetical protein